MGQARRIFDKKIHKGDALIVLACGAGIKSAYSIEPSFDIPIIAVTDPTGSVPVLNQFQYGNLIGEKVCTMCGHCVISHTSGICPVNGCPAKSKYGPCKNAPETEGPCYINSDIPCIWKIIEKKTTNVNYEMLTNLSEIHRAEYNRPEITIKPNSSSPLKRKIFGYFGARLAWLEYVISTFK
jgi:methylene-tetrahydrofolate reductase-like protein